MGKGPSWRLQFVDIDSSFSISNATSTILGYMVCRAPKGETEPMFFPPGSEAAIHSMIGIPTADWPDLAEAVAFNREFGLYISAPSGSSEENPSTYGGKYITNYGAFDFVGVTDKDNPDYNVKVKFGSEDTTLGIMEPTMEIVQLSDIRPGSIVQGQLSIDLGNKLIQNVSTFTLDFWGVEGGAIPGTYTYQLMGEDVYCLDNFGDILTDLDGNNIVVGKVEESKVILGKDGENTLNDTTIPFIAFNDLVEGYDNLFLVNALAGTTPFLGLDVIGTITAEKQAIISNIILNASGTTDIIVDSTTYTFSPKVAVAFKNGITWNYNVKNDTYAYIVQKSPSAKKTSITINNIGYDQYIYDKNLKYMAYPAANKEEALEMLAEDGTAATIIADEDNLFVVGTLPAGQEDLPENYEIEIYQYTAQDVEGKLVGKTTNVTSQFKTQTIFCRESFYDLTGNPSSRALTDKLFIIDEEIGHLNSTPALDISYNTINFTIAEEVYPGQMTSGGTFHGSLSETGKDSYGANIYLPNVLPDDSLSFVEVRVLKTFDDDLVDGFFKGNKIVDIKGPGANSYSTTMEGTRYVTHLVNENIKAGTTGGSWLPEFYDVYNRGWIEATQPKYDECHIFMECSGQETFKATLSSLRQTHKLSTVISPKIITQAEADNPSTIAVAGRMTGTAQFVGEFLILDSYTSKKYWCQPIGDVGVNLARIMDQKLGGWAPMWNNITGGLGGQLSRSVLKAKWDLNDNATKVMDEKGINPIIYNSDDGLMIVSQKTTQDPTNLTDWSYLGHTMAFDLCKREIRDTVMRAQIGKPNDTYWQNVRQQQVDAVLAKRITGTQPTWTAAKADISGVNTDAVKAQRKFVIKVTVKVTIFSEVVELIFENVGQTTSI